MFNIAGTAFPKYDYMYAWLTQLYVHTYTCQGHVVYNIVF